MHDCEAQKMIHGARWRQILLTYWKLTRSRNLINSIQFWTFISGIFILMRLLYMQQVLPLDYSSFHSHWYSWELLPLLPASRLLSQMALLQTWLMLLPSVLYFIIIVIVVVIIININISISRHGGFPKSGSPTDNFPSGSGNLTRFSQASQTRELENVASAPSAVITTTFAPNTYSQISA